MIQCNVEVLFVSSRSPALPAILSCNQKKQKLCELDYIYICI